MGKYLDGCRKDLVKKAIGEMYGKTRRDIIKLNLEKKLVEGEELTIRELDRAWGYIYEGRCDLLPHLYPEMNDRDILEKSITYWGDLWEVVKEYKRDWN